MNLAIRYYKDYPRIELPVKNINFHIITDKKVLQLYQIGNLNSHEITLVINELDSSGRMNYAIWLNVALRDDHYIIRQDCIRSSDDGTTSNEMELNEMLYLVTHHDFQSETYDLNRIKVKTYNHLSSIWNCLDLEKLVQGIPLDPLEFTENLIDIMINKGLMSPTHNYTASTFKSNVGPFKIAYKKTDNWSDNLDGMIIADIKEDKFWRWDIKDKKLEYIRGDLPPHFLVQLTTLMIGITGQIELLKQFSFFL